MTKFLIAFGLFFALGKNLYAQLSSIQTDRPDQTECPFIVPKNYLQIENGFSYEKGNKNAQSYSFPATLWKFGVNANVELRLITELISSKTYESQTTGILPVTFGFKAKLLEEKGLLPLTSFIGHLTTSDWGSKKFSTHYAVPSFRFTMQHTLSDKISLAYNIGMEWDGETPATTYIYTLTTGFSLTQKWNSYIEIYGFVPQNFKANHKMDSGFTYLINENLMTDISGGIGLTSNVQDFFISLGISYRFNICNTLNSFF